MLGVSRQPELFLIQVLFDLYAFIVILRILLQLHRASFYNPVCQFVVKMTDPLIQPLRSVLPRTRLIDLSSLILLYILSLVKYLLLFTIAQRMLPPFIPLLIISLLGIIKQVIDLYFYAIIIRVIISWIGAPGYSPVKEILFKLTEPLLAPVRRLIPLIAGFDISPVLVLILLKLISVILS
jgi:YggT family protein